MRARLHETWPALSYHFGLHADQAPYTHSLAELQRYNDALLEMQHEAEAAKKQARRR